MGFKNFILSESHSYLGQRVGDVLSAIHDLQQSGAAMGTRHLSRNAGLIVSHIRRILHTGWPEEEQKYLLPLQRAGVAIMKVIEEKGDLRDALGRAAHALEDLSKDIGVPQNDLMGSPPAGQTSPVPPDPGGQPKM